MNGIERYQFIRIYVQLEVFHEREFTYERIFDFTRRTAVLFRILALKFNHFIKDSRYLTLVTCYLAPTCDNVCIINIGERGQVGFSLQLPSFLGV